MSRAGRGSVHELLLLDVLSRQAAELRRLASIVESSDDTIIGKNVDGTIATGNKGAERLFGDLAEEGTANRLRS